VTAPVAPRIFVRQNGNDIYVRFQPVPTATDYKLYVGDTVNPTGLEADIPDDDIEVDGWFFYVVTNESGLTYVRLTALNVGAEESGYSNEVQVNVQTIAGNGQTSAVNHASRMAQGRFN
jgi:hypothetical protein